MNERQRPSVQACLIFGLTHLYNPSDNRWKPSQNGRASWYSQHVPEGYGTFEQFRNGYDFRVP